MGHACLGKYKDPKNCDKCIDLKKCKALGNNTIEAEPEKPSRGRGKKAKEEEPNVNLDEFFPESDK